MVLTTVERKMLESAKDFWKSEESSEVFKIANAEQKTFQPILANMIKEIGPKRLLDYGCGDSFVTRLIDKSIEVGLYDINIAHSKKAMEHLKECVSTLYESPSEIPSNYYDCILFSLVLICIDNVQEFRDILSTFIRVKTMDGRVIIATTHPCFRQYKYRPFYADYAEGNEFDYFNELASFKVSIRDGVKDVVSFTDYHWTLSKTINEITAAGLSIESVHETPDYSYDGIGKNRLYPPFLIFLCK